MSGEIAKKLLLKSGMQARFINAPAGFWETFGMLPKDVALQSGGVDTSDFVLLFARNVKELNQVANSALKSLRRNGVFWTAFPKKRSGKQTDLTINSGWEALEDEGWGSVASASIDEIWSVSRWRPKRRKTP